MRAGQEVGWRDLVKAIYRGFYYGLQRRRVRRYESEVKMSGDLSARI
jgi:hypothetical protein